MAGQMVTEPTVNAETDEPKLPLGLRRSGETRVLMSPLSLERARERFALYLGAGKSRKQLARVQGRTVVARRVDGHLQLQCFRRYRLGVLTTAFCVLKETPHGTRVLMTLSTLRYRRAYTVTLLLAGIVGIMIFAPASALWMRALLGFGVLLIVSSWRLSRPTRETIEEKRFLAEFVRNLLDAEEVSPPARRGEEALETATTAKGGLVDANST